MKGTFVSQVNFRIEKLGFSTVWKGLRNTAQSHTWEFLGKVTFDEHVNVVQRSCNCEEMRHIC